MIHTEFEDEIYIKHHTLNVYVLFTARVTKEMYGQDADGNRGEMVTEIDEVEFKAMDSRDNDISRKLRLKYPKVYEQLKLVATEKCLNIK